MKKNYFPGTESRQSQDFVKKANLTAKLTPYSFTLFTKFGVCGKLPLKD